jgi:predicted Rossmann fold nucleotide-binding protein DprA/Smf involved in DNA uptake
MSERVRGIGIVGARALPDDFRDQVSGVVRYLLERGYSIHTGGAMGADLFALRAVIDSGAIDRGMIFSAWSSADGFPRDVLRYVDYFVSHRGRVSWGITPAHSSRSLAVAGLISRNQRLVRASVGLVAFLYGDSSGTIRTIRYAISRGIRVVVFVCGGGAVLPGVSGQWVPLRCSVQCWGGGFIYRA